MLAVLGDQRGDAERGVFVDFFGSPAPANEVFARLAIDGEARILPLCTYRRDDGKYQSIFWDEIRLERHRRQKDGSRSRLVSNFTICSKNGCV